MIAGAGAGIGRVTSERFVVKGANVFAADIDPTGIKPTGRFDLFSLDVTKEDEWNAAVTDIVARCGQLASPEVIAPAIPYLACVEASFMAGAGILIDGARTAQ